MHSDEKNYESNIQLEMIDYSHYRNHIPLANIYIDFESEESFNASLIEFILWAGAPLERSIFNPATSFIFVDKNNRGLFFHIDEGQYQPFENTLENDEFSMPPISEHAFKNDALNLRLGQKIVDMFCA